MTNQSSNNSEQERLDEIMQRVEEAARRVKESGIFDSFLEELASQPEPEPGEDYPDFSDYPAIPKGIQSAMISYPSGYMTDGMTVLDMVHEPIRENEERFAKIKRQVIRWYQVRARDFGGVGPHGDMF